MITWRIRMLHKSNMFSEEEQERINIEAHKYLEEIADKSPEMIFKALLTYHMIHEAAVYEKIYEEQERISLLLEELLDVVYETDELVSQATQNEAEYICPLTEPDHNTIGSESHRQLSQAPFLL